jgi:general secretion pathway protein G
MSTANRLGTRRRGFTLIELLITVAVLGLLAQSAMSFADLAVKRSHEQELRTALRQLRSAIDAYKQMADAKRIAVAADESGYPRSLAELTEGIPDLRSVKGARHYFLRSLPRDPMADPTLPAAATWGLRSYASEPDNPQSGRDVFDVSSRSTRIGLNGRPYSTW